MKHEKTRQVIIRLVSEGKPEKRATLTFIDDLPPNAWEEYIKPFLVGERKFGKAERTLTINIIVKPHQPTRRSQF